jgi:trk system potassium uptake protein TrkH
MRLYVVIRYVAFALLLNALFMAISTSIAVFYHDSSFMPLLYSTLVTALFGFFPLIFIPPTSHISNKEGLSIVVLSWLLSCLVGTIPYILWGGVFTFTNAWFESVSGFTTTGSTILVDIETLPFGLLFWRSATHWIGGIGIIIFVLSVLPFLGEAEVVLFRSEVSTVVKKNFHYRARGAIHILAGVYLGLTILETMSLLLAGMNLFDALTHSFATVATGGFSPKNNSIAYYNNSIIETIIIIFMIFSGIHFGLLFSVASGNIKNLLKSTVVKYYVFALFLGVLMSTINIHGIQYHSWPDSLRFAAFQIVSIGTSTGFATTDTSVWPPLSQLLIIFFALQCACSGSTSGGIKVDRIVILWKSFIRHIKKLMHPNAVITVRLENESIREDLVSNITLYIMVYLLIVLVSTFLLSALNVDMLSSFSGTVATMGNVGPGLGSVGSTGNFNHIPDMGKWILTMTMLLGRLEIYAIFIFFMPGQWRKTISY